MINIYLEAGKRIYEMRSARGYTREQLSELADISSKFLYEIETGKKGFSADILYRLSIALEINSDYILTGNKECNYDIRLKGILELFNATQIENIEKLLKVAYELQFK